MLPIGTNPFRRRRGNFLYPDRRMRLKSTPHGSEAAPPASQDLETLAQAADDAVDHEAEEAEAQPSQQDEMDWAADDEAAKFLGHDE